MLYSRALGEPAATPTEANPSAPTPPVGATGKAVLPPTDTGETRDLNFDSGDVAEASESWKYMAYAVSAALVLFIFAPEIKAVFRGVKNLVTR